jgi:hypothetical protein
MEGTRKDDRGEEPYSPGASTVTSDEEFMDWSNNLQGVRALLNDEEQAEQAGEQLAEGLPGDYAEVPEQQQVVEPQVMAENLAQNLVPTVQVPPPVASGSTEGDQQPPAGGAPAPSQSTPRADTGGEAPPPVKNSQDNLDCVERSRAFVQAAYRKKIDDIVESMSDDILQYRAVNNEKARIMEVTDLRTGETKPGPDLGSMLTSLDGRMRIVDLEVNLGQKMVWTYSISRRTMECIGCSKHFNVISFPRRGTGGRGGLQAVWLCDQSMPPILPSSSELGCVKIFRMEHGMLADLADGLVRLLSARQIAAGSVVLLCSLTNMAIAGTVGYANDLMAAIKFLRVNLGDHVLYGPLPCLMMNGCGDEATIRTAFEISRWATTAFGRSYGLVHNSFKLVDQMAMERGEGIPQTDYRCRIRLPLADRANLGATMTVTSGGWEGMPSYLPQLSREQERKAVESIIEELRTNMAVDLDPHPVVDRWPAATARPAAGGGPHRNFLVVGSSHAGKIGAALRKKGNTAEVIYETAWRATRTNIEDMFIKVQEKLEKGHVDMIIFCVLDNSVYFGLDESGNTAPPQRGEDGSYHVIGDLILSSKTAQHALFKSLKPLIDQGRNKNCILVAPLPRYINKGCCDAADHITNRSDTDFGKRLLTDLREAANNLKDFLFTAGMRQVKILDPQVSWRDSDDSEVWGEDPVHPTAAGYEMLAAGVEAMCNGLESGGKKRARSDSYETGDGPSGLPHNNRPRLGASSYGRGSGGGAGSRGGMGNYNRGRGGGNGGRRAY